ncbi:MAG TPA: NAD-dependent epimerase/dehydratase family protein [Cytophagaceae bacterium]
MIFITGASGLVGSYLVRRLLCEDVKIRALKRPTSDLSLVGEFASQIEWVEGDISDITFLEDTLKGVDTVIHSAAIVSFAPSRKEQMYKVNVEGTANIVNAALKSKVSRFCHISSIAAIGRNKNEKVINENSSWVDSEYNTWYAKTKYLAELEVWRGIEEGLNAFIVNPSVVLGPGFFDTGSTKLFKYVWDEKLFYTEGEMNFIDVRDVSEIVYQLLNSDIMAERFILNSGKIRYKDFFEIIAKNFNKKAPTIKATPFMSECAWRIEKVRSFFIGNEPLITKETARLGKNSWYYSNDKIKKILNYDFRTLEESVEWICGNLKERLVHK